MKKLILSYQYLADFRRQGKVKAAYNLFQAIFVFCGVNPPDSVSGISRANLVSSG